MPIAQSRTAAVNRPASAAPSTFGSSSCDLGRGGREVLLRRRADGGCEGRGLAQGAVHVHAGDLAGRDDLAGLRIARLVQEANGFLADLEQMAAHLDDVAREQ